MFYQNWQNFLRYVILRLSRTKYFILNGLLNVTSIWKPFFIILMYISSCTTVLFIFKIYFCLTLLFKTVYKLLLIDWLLKTTDNSMWFVFYVSLLTCLYYIMYLLDLSSIYLIYFLICFKIKLWYNYDIISIRYLIYILYPFDSYYYIKFLLDLSSIYLIFFKIIFIHLII